MGEPPDTGLGQRSPHNLAALSPFTSEVSVLTPEPAMLHRPSSNKLLQRKPRIIPGVDPVAPWDSG